jgi:hypothetical protein
MRIELSIKKTAIVLLLSFCFSCSQESEVQSRSNQASTFQVEADYLKPIVADSFLVDGNSGMFFNTVPHLDPDLYSRNRVFVTNKQNVAMGLIDSLGNFIQQITERGTGPGEIVGARSAKAWQSNDGGIYVLTNANVYMLYVFNPNGDFRYSLRLFQSLPDYFHAKGSSFHISEKRDGIFYLTIAVNTVLADVFESGYHEGKDALAQFEISELQQKVLSVKTFFPYENLPEIKEAIATKKVCWYGSDAKFQVLNEKIYVTFSFSNEVFVLNRELEIEKRFALKAIEQLRLNGRCIDLNAPKPETLYDRTYSQFETYLSNLHITDIQVMDDLAILQFVLPLSEKEFLPDFPTEEQARDLVNYKGFFQTRDQYWLVYNMKNGNEALYRLSPEHGRGVFLDKSRLLVEKSSDDSESQYLMKYTMPQAIGQ